MKILYQLSRENCPPCQRLKEKIHQIKNKSFDYRYINIDSIVQGTMEHQILLDARKNRISSLPIVGITNLEDGIEAIDFVVNIKNENIDNFIEIIQ